MDKIKLDGRLGFSLEIFPEQLEILTGNDRLAAKKLLVELVQSEQCHIVGDTYFPVDWNEEVLDGVHEDNLEFDLPVISLHDAAEQNKLDIARKVELENFKNALECLGYSPDDFDKTKLNEMFDDLNDRLANDDVYNDIYNETLVEVVKEYEKVNNIDNLISKAEQTCEDVNKSGASKDDLEFGK